MLDVPRLSVVYLRVYAGVACLSACLRKAGLYLVSRTHKHDTVRSRAMVRTSGVVISGER